jgi:hypothetical protein
MPRGPTRREDRMPTGAYVSEGRMPRGAYVKEGRMPRGAYVREGRMPRERDVCPEDPLNTYLVGIKKSPIYSIKTYIHTHTHTKYGVRMCAINLCVSAYA